MDSSRFVIIQQNPENLECYLETQPKNSVSPIPVAHVVMNEKPFARDDAVGSQALAGASWLLGGTVAQQWWVVHALLRLQP